MSQPKIQPLGITKVPLETRQLFNPSQGFPETGQVSRSPLQRTSPKTQLSRKLEESVCPSLEAEYVAC